MTRYRRILGVLAAASALVLITAVMSSASPLRHSAASSKPASAARVGTLIMVTGVISDRHPGAKRALALRSGAAVDRGDVITPGTGASARIVFAAAAKRASGTLFTLEAPTADTQNILAGAARLGPRLAFAREGSKIAAAVGSGLDAGTQLGGVKSAGRGAVRITFSAPTDHTSPFACSVDHGAFRACTSPLTLHLRAGSHSVAVRTTSVFGFHGSATQRRFRVVG